MVDTFGDVLSASMDRLLGGSIGPTLLAGKTPVSYFGEMKVCVCRLYTGEQSRTASLCYTDGLLTTGLGTAQRTRALSCAHEAHARRYLALLVYHGHVKKYRELGVQPSSCVM